MDRKVKYPMLTRKKYDAAIRGADGAAFVSAWAGMYLEYMP